jgi:hypothetical protein
VVASGKGRHKAGVFIKPEYAEESRRVLSLSLEDYEWKVSLYDDLLVQIALFVSMRRISI